MSIRSRRWAKTLVPVAMVLMVMCLLSREPLAAMGSVGVSSSIGQAEAAIRKAFNSTVYAEGAGANVSSLIARLNEAGDLLTRAEVAYGNGDLSQAEDLAGQSLTAANSVRDDALTMRDSASAATRSLVSLSVVSWAFAFPVFILFLGIVWSLFKRFYSRRLMKSRPEVASDAEA